MLFKKGNSKGGRRRELSLLKKIIRTFIKTIKSFLGKKIIWVGSLGLGKSKGHSKEKKEQKKSGLRMVEERNCGEKSMVNGEVSKREANRTE